MAFTGSSDASLPSFFTTHNLTTSDLHLCLSFARSRFPLHEIEALPSWSQGACSFTVSCCKGESDGGEEDAIVQFRVLRHAVSARIAEDAVRVYGSLAPRVVLCEEMVVGGGRVRLQVLGMRVVQGRRVDSMEVEKTMEMQRLLRGFARFFAAGWEGRGGDMNGKIGSMILQRLGWLEERLPEAWMRRRAKEVRIAVEEGGLDALPVVLNHGDLLPSNTMVDEEMRLTGLVDWAEAEYLSFGVSLYGVEHLLGRMIHATECGRRICRFEYHQDAPNLRRHFWNCLLAEIPALKGRQIWRAMLLSREVGILLWHGIAWDDGNLNRVVNEQDDGEELAYLEAFLTSDVGFTKSML